MIELERLGLNRNNKIIEIANTKPVFVTLNSPIKEVVAKLVSSGHRSLPVVEKNNKLSGIITITDVLDIFLKNESFEDPVENFMTRWLVLADVNDQIGFVLQKMKISKKGRLPVVSGKQLMGIVGERDFVFNFNTKPFDEVKNEEIMTRKPFFLKTDDTVLTCIKTMVNAKYRRLPIVDDNKLKGYVTSTYILKKLFENNFEDPFLSKNISEVMVDNPYTLKSSETVSKSIELMKEKIISSVLLVDDSNNLEGILTERDIIDVVY